MCRKAVHFCKMYVLPYTKNVYSQNSEKLPDKNLKAKIWRKQTDGIRSDPGGFKFRFKCIQSTSAVVEYSHNISLYVGDNLSRTTDWAVVLGAIVHKVQHHAV